MLQLAQSHLYLVIDVESVGLYGEGFAFGWVLVTQRGRELDRGYFYTHPDGAEGTEEDRAWVQQHIPVPTKDECSFFPTPKTLRAHVWSFIKGISDQHLPKPILVADCPFPVETNFLSRVIQENGPLPMDMAYPFLDVGSIRHGVGLDAVGTEPRLSEELPIHNPMRDARQSARLLLEALQLGTPTPTY